MQLGGCKAGGALRLSLPSKSSVVIPGGPSARLNRCLKLNTGQWLLRLSVLRETPMTSTSSSPFQKPNMLLLMRDPHLILFDRGLIKSFMDPSSWQPNNFASTK
jgi:hypothetical protein